VVSDTVHTTRRTLPWIECRAVFAIICNRLKGFDSPGASNRRIGALMSEEEKFSLAPEKYRSPNIKDVWWDGYTDENLKNFSSVFGVAIDRFLGQPELFEKIRESKAQQRIGNAIINICQEDAP